MQDLTASYDLLVRVGTQLDRAIRSSVAVGQYPRYNLRCSPLSGRSEIAQSLPSQYLEVPLAAHASWHGDGSAKHRDGESQDTQRWPVCLTGLPGSRQGSQVNACKRGGALSDFAVPH